MDKETLVSFGVIGASNNLGYLMQLPAAHALQRDGEVRGREMKVRRRGSYVSEHKIGTAEIHVREEYRFGVRRFYVMTASERVRDVAEFMEFSGLNFN